MAHTHDVYDMENHFEINGSSRFIKETSVTKLAVVQGDHKSEVLTFKMPRYIDGHDMTLCNKIRIHYINLDTKTNNKSADVYEVTDLTLCEECEDVLTFTWTIEAPATKYSGTLSFLVKFECTEGENVLYQWNTAKYVSVNVLAGIDNSEEFVEKYSNVLEEWYNELTKGADSIEELNQQALAEIELAKEDAKEDIQGKADATMAEMNQFSSNAYNSFKNDVDEKAEEALASIPDDYTTLAEEVSELSEQNAELKSDLSQLSEENAELKGDLEKLNDGGLNIKDEVITEDISNWLNEHPEATTTVQDGAITELKIHSDFLPYIKKDYVTPEMFGAVGDGLTDDTVSFQNALNYCVEKNVTLKSCGKTYYLPIDLNIPEICIDFNYGTLKGAGNTITLNNSIFKNIRLYDFTISTSGADLIIDSVFFDKWLGTALLLNTGTYSHHIKNLYFSQPDDVEDYTGNVGIEYKCTDTVVDGVEGHGFKTAIIVNGANNGLKNSQLWIRRHSNFSGSIFMQLNATNFFLSDTIIDTWENVFVGLYTYLFCQLKNVSYIHNTEMCDNENVTVFTNCSLFSGDILLKLTNFEASGCTCSIGSFSHVNVQVIDGKLSQPLQMDADDILNALPDSTETTSYNVSEDSFIRVNNGTFFSHLTISVTGTSPAGNIDIDVSALSNVESINVRGKALAALKLSDGSISFGWVYYFKSGKKISITLPTNVVGWWQLTINEATPASY